MARTDERDAVERTLAARRESLERVARAASAVPSSLPIADRAAELVEVIKNNQVVIVAGETGSGKSTQLPKLCVQAGLGTAGMIGHTQPRRVAARTVAERVADELGSRVGEAVGYSVRFNDRVSDGTVIRVMTDGILLNELHRDPLLERYDTLIVDEAHERSLNIDFILGYLRQLLPKRPDLTVIVTSATIDTERFAEHFAVDGEPAPIVVVEGRTYPVEVRYRPYGADNEDDPDDRRDQVRAVIDAVDELGREGAGDVLVFLSGEREIHDTADALRRLERSGTEVLPLYARLSSAEQHRIFQPHPGRRIVLSTNVAETSITVPGVRYVIDAGTARVSRYSRRLKVQRLPIEPVSQASANQRAGRCGRVAPGVCIRLYSADDFDGRDEFTEPEILRTNLASVILQMTAIGLGDVERFPFVESPDRASIRDGYTLLDELGAMQAGRVGAPRRLTKTGRRLARLPVDPRLGRMVIEAGRLDCLRDVLVIASALSIQDVRERPQEAAERAAESHRRFDVDGSDLLSIIELWNYLQQRQRELSGNAFRRMCRDEYLNYLRVREWRDLYSQLRQAAGQAGLKASSVDAHPDRVHRAVLSGLLSHVGMRDGDRGEYRGARDARFAIARGSVLSRRGPTWVMAAELVETNRLWARRVATIQPGWAESLGSHLVKYSYGEPWWDRESGRALVAETATLYGLPIVDGRRVPVDRVDPKLAREMFVRHALVGGDWDADHEFLRTNERFLQRVSLLEARVRRTDLIDDEVLLAFYDERVPDDVTSERRFDAWWSSFPSDGAGLLDLGPSELRNRAGIVLSDYPDSIELGGVTCPLSYRFDPGTPLDGASAEVPLTALNQVDATGLGWLVPGYRRELVGQLVRSLPKDVRRDLIPMAETADAAFERLGTPSGRLVDALARALGEVAETTIDPDDFDLSKVPEFLRLHLVVVDDDGGVVDAGDDLEAIRNRQAGSARTALADAAPIDERRNIVSWDVGTLDRVVEQTRPDGHVVRAYPTLLDRGDSVSLRVVDNPSLQQRAMQGGVRRLLLMAAAPTATKVERTLDPTAALSIAASAVSVSDLAADAVEAAVDAVMARHELPWSDPDFRRLEQAVRADAPQIAADALAVAGDIVAAVSRVHRRAMALSAEALQPTVSDALAHADRLIVPGFIRRSGTDRLPDIHRYVRGIEHRLDHLAGDVARDRRRMAEVRPVERALASALADSPHDVDLRPVAWMIEELRMSVFAQAVGVDGPVSVKRIRTEYQRITGERLDV